MENDSKIIFTKNKDEIRDPRIELFELEEELKNSTPNIDTLGKFGKVLNTKMYQIGDSMAPSNLLEAKKDISDFISSSKSWAYLIGLIIFFALFILFLISLISSGVSHNLSK